MFLSNLVLKNLRYLVKLLRLSVVFTYLVKIVAKLCCLFLPVSMSQWLTLGLVSSNSVALSLVILILYLTQVG